MGDFRSGLVIFYIEEVELDIRDNEEVVLVTLDMFKEGRDYVADGVEAGTDPDIEDTESIICEVAVVVSFSMSISIIISLLIIPQPSS